LEGARSSAGELHGTLNMRDGCEVATAATSVLFDAVLRRSIDRSAREAYPLLRPVGVASALRSVLKEVGSAAPASTIRALDRLWRSAPGECFGALAPVYGRLLALESKHPQDALNMLQRASAEFPDADGEALRAHLLAQMNLPVAAREQIDATLERFSCIQGELLSCIAGQLARDSRLGVTGWVGRGPELELVGESTAAGSSGEALLGSRHILPRDFALDGRTGANGNVLTGWVRLGWLPVRAPALRARDECDVEVEVPVRARNSSIGAYRWPFEMNLREAGLRGMRIEVEAKMPDGRWQPLPDSPLLLPRALRGRKNQSARRARSAVAAAVGVDVIIPVHGGRAESLACIDSVIRTVGDRARVVIVDDASDDVELARELDSLQASGTVTLLRNARNLGFVQSVNRALCENERHDVVILNSDTVVFGDWLTRLKCAAYSASNVATVTPFTNTGSIASYPSPDGNAMEPTAAADLDALAATANPGARFQIPVGVGFCLYVRRDCIEAIGNFDAAAFAMGYGEEADFCLRAREHGWVHLLAADTFIFHAGAVSFGRRRNALLERSDRILNLRYPGYDRFVAAFLSANPLRPARRRLDEQRLSALDGRFVLIVTLSLPGGVDHFVKQRCRTLRAQGLVPLVLRPIRADDSSQCSLWTDALEGGTPSLQYNIPGELSELTRMLQSVAPGWVEIQHFLHLDARLVETVRALAPYDVVIHDYSWICPRITLIDGSGRYCGEPAVEICGKCVKRNGSLLGETISVPSLRQRSEAWLRGARRVFAPSSDTAARIRNHFAAVEVEIQPHTATEWHPSGRPFAQGKVTTVGLIGALGRHKGFDVLLACAADAVRRRLRLQFVVIGYTEDDRRLEATGKVFVTGRYLPQELPHLLEREKPDIALFPGVWPETWCYALDEAMEAGLPIAAFDIGAIGERLRGRGGATLLPLTSTAAEINDQILKATRCRDSAAPEAPLESLSSSVQVLPLPPGLYRFSVTEAAPAPAAGNLRLPALHVGIAPGVPTAEVEFTAGTGTHGGWLVTRSDVLTVRVLGTGSTLLLTSVRQTGGAVISVKVERVGEAGDAPVVSPGNGALVATVVGKKRAAGLSVKVAAHIRARGDMSFVDVDWAGRVAPGLWIESFSIQPLRHIEAADIEYKALTGGGFETPWLSDDRMCGTRGLSTPLLGFAIRLKPRVTAYYDVEYSGYFQSGLTIGPVRNGAPCRSSVAGDPLEGIQIRLLKRATRPRRRP
jgi:GT2 family glycosyltransferase